MLGPCPICDGRKTEHLAPGRVFCDTCGFISVVDPLGELIEFEVSQRYKPAFLDAARRRTKKRRTKRAS